MDRPLRCRAQARSPRRFSSSTTAASTNVRARTSPSTTSHRCSRAGPPGGGTHTPAAAESRNGSARTSWESAGLAMGAMRAVFDAGLTVPDDVAIIGIDDIEEGRYSRPSLSTVSLDTAFIARTAVARLAARIEDPALPAEEFIAPHTLIARESTETRPSPG